MEMVGQAVKHDITPQIRPMLTFSYSILFFIDPKVPAFSKFSAKATRILSFLLMSKAVLQIPGIVA
jgi:hypothetical protein